MAITARVQHCFQASGGTSKDMFCNQFYFWHATETAATVSSWGPTLAARVHGLFVEPTDGQQISRYYASRCLGNGGKTSIYDGAAAGAPLFVISDDALLGGTEYLTDVTGYNDTAVQLPHEVAVCLSYQALHTDGNLPRRRGRIYLGPFNVAILDPSTSPTNRPRVADTFVTTALTAAQNIQEAAAANGWFWRVYSQRDGFAFDIVNFSIDDEFDTVRGRGLDSGTRVTVPV